MTGKTASQIKREMGLDKTDSPWNYDSALDLVLNQILAIIAKGFHDKRHSPGVEALAKDITDSKSAVDSVRETLIEQFSAQPRPLPERYAKQIQLIGRRKNE